MWPRRIDATHNFCSGIVADMWKQPLALSISDSFIPGGSEEICRRAALKRVVLRIHKQQCGYSQLKTSGFFLLSRAKLATWGSWCPRRREATFQLLMWEETKGRRFLQPLGMEELKKGKAQLGGSCCERTDSEPTACRGTHQRVLLLCSSGCGVTSPPRAEACLTLATHAGLQPPLAPPRNWIQRYGF